MLSLLLVVHSLLRWVVVIAVVARFALALRGWLGRTAWSASDQRIGTAAVAATDTQVLLGLLLYGFSPTVSAAMQAGGAAMGDRQLRFWMVEHPVMMVLGLIALHLGHALAKRVSDDGARHRRVAIGFGVGMLLILAGIPWPSGAVARPLLPF